MQRVFIESPQIQQNRIYLTGDEVHHLTRVIRLSIGDMLLCCDGNGTDYHVEIISIEKKQMVAKIVETFPSQGEPQRKVTVAQALPKGDKIEWVFQKGTELGADRFIPFTSTRSIVKLQSDRASKRLVRWRKIVREAAEQSGRGRVPAVDEICQWKELLEQCSSFQRIWIAYEKGGESLSEQLPTDPDEQVLVIIGPEGGFTSEEVYEARKNGAIPITLGHRILRTETASLAVLAGIFATGGEWK